MFQSFGAAILKACSAVTVRTRGQTSRLFDADLSLECRARMRPSGNPVQKIRFRRSDCFERNSCNFKVDMMTHRQPVKFPQVFSYVFRLSHPGDHTGGKVLNSLESPDVGGRHFGEDGITVVDSRTHH